MIEIDRSRCIQCMTCVTVCPFTVLEEVDGFPSKVEGKYCMRCMHCGASCPAEAITYGGKPSIMMDDIPPVGRDFARDLKNFLLRRRSYRHFSQEPVPRKIIEKALDVASWAPSAKNQHPVKWMIIESEDVIEEIMNIILRKVGETGKDPEIASELEVGNNIVMGTASTLLLAYSRNNAISPETDTAIAMTTAELYLQAKGIGTCWAGYLKRYVNEEEEIRALLPQLPDNNSFYGAFMLGYPEDENYIHVPERVKRADIKWV